MRPTTLAASASILVFALASPALSQAETQDQAPDQASQETPTVLETPRVIYNINGYNVIDEEHLVLRASVRDHYLVTLRRRCSGLRFGAAIGTSFGDRLRTSQARFEYVVSRNGDRCHIQSVEAVESDEAARALIAARAEDEAGTGSD